MELTFTDVFKYLFYRVRLDRPLKAFTEAALDTHQRLMKKTEEEAADQVTSPRSAPCI